MFFAAHGTFIGTMRLEAHKPTQLHVNSTFHFGASTRYDKIFELKHHHILPKWFRFLLILDITYWESVQHPVHDPTASWKTYRWTNQPTVLCSVCQRAKQTWTWVFVVNLSCVNVDWMFAVHQQNLTEYNTAHNRRISMLGITDNSNTKKNKGGKRKRRGVTFNDEECIINPEDVDPNVGRFRNLVQTTVVPAKRGRIDTNFIGFSSLSTTTSASDMVKHLHPTSFMPRLYQDLPPIAGDNPSGHAAHSHIHGSASGGSGYGDDHLPTSQGLGSKLSLILPNPAPDVDPATDAKTAAPSLSFGVSQQGKPTVGFHYNLTSTIK